MLCMFQPSSCSNTSDSSDGVTIRPCRSLTTTFHLSQVCWSMVTQKTCRAGLPQEPDWQPLNYSEDTLHLHVSYFQKEFGHILLLLCLVALNFQTTKIQRKHADYAFLKACREKKNGDTFHVITTDSSRQRLHISAHLISWTCAPLEAWITSSRISKTGNIFPSKETRSRHDVGFPDHAISRFSGRKSHSMWTITDMSSTDWHNSQTCPHLDLDQVLWNTT